jgi:fucose 4-O-acetylase-like acetyltransferase
MTSTLEARWSPPAVPRPSPPVHREPWLDNAKMLLVTLVVVGHSWTLLPDSLARHWFYDFLYLWHIPAFVMVTGYLSRSFTWSRRHLERLVTTVAVPYATFEAALAAFRIHVGGTDLDRLFIDPHWPMWYLAVLFLWRLATPLLGSPGGLAVALVVSLLGGLTTGDVLDTARAMGLLPFFVLGLLGRPEHVEVLRRPLVRVGAVVSLGITFALAALVDGRMRTEWLYWRSSYAELDATFLEGVAVRSALLAVAAVLALSFLSLVPRRGGWFSRLGAATLVVYLFHGFFVRSAEYAGFDSWAAHRPWTALVVTSAAAVVLSLMLALPPVARRLNVLVDPVGAFGSRRPVTQSPRSGRVG